MTGAQEERCKKKAYSWGVNFEGFCNGWLVGTRASDLAVHLRP